MIELFYMFPFLNKTITVYVCTVLHVAIYTNGMRALYKYIFMRTHTNILYFIQPYRLDECLSVYDC